MSAVAIALLAFALLLGSATGAMALRKLLPSHHFADDSKDALKAGLAVIGTIGGLVLGLLVAAATGSYNTQRGYVVQMAAEIDLLDRALAHYGSEARPVRDELRVTAQRILLQMWPSSGRSLSAVPGGARNEELFDRLEDLSPKSPAQTSVKQIAINLVLDIARTRYLIAAQLDTTVSSPLLVMLVFWFCVTFAGIGVFAPRNVTTVSGIALCALAIAGAIFVVLEMYAPFGGVMRIPSAALEDAIGRLGR